MCTGKSIEPTPDSLRRFLRCARRMPAQRHHAVCNGEEIFHPVIHLPEEQLLMCLGALALRNIASDFRRANDRTASIPDRGDGQRNVDQTSILASTHGFMVIDVLTTPDSCKD